ncbi:MAG: transketolase [Bacteroidales bacterium]|jgi:transketolase|nr:transketolase [Bacteroidales bacterium]OQC45064.1 MAG: Transketolase 2 [Bacteroidetes bacterium ADurb.Bin028]NLP20131.1 transketolase [Bacteroidales bacterium]HOD88706.1 transketolase [Bacteroidales bacterium]HPX75373.1 transketolase [Bacteroidales bacterium]
MENIQKLEKIASQVRRDLLRMIHAKKSGHPGGSLGVTDLLVCLYFEIMDHNKDFKMDGKNEDIFFLSIGHTSAAWYSVLARSGYFPVKELASFRAIDSRLQGHPATAEGLPGVRIASGSLGQGLSNACGAALAKKLNNDKKFVYCLLGDGEIQEGQVWEAALFAQARKIDNLIAFIDYNGQQIDGTIEDVMNLKNLRQKWEAFNWIVLECNGNNMQELISTIKKAQELSGKEQPIMILSKTEMGHGVDFMTGSHKWHGVPPSDEQLENALSQLEETLGDY